MQTITFKLFMSADITGEKKQITNCPTAVSTSEPCEKGVDYKLDMQLKVHARRVHAATYH